MATNLNANLSPMDALESLCKRRGFVNPSSEIYQGLRSVYDYGPYGAEMRRNIRNLWWQYMVSSREDVVGVETSILMNPKTWEASGHVQNFTDPMVDCKGKCHKRWREDKVAEERALRKKDESLLACPECDGVLSVAKNFNLMFQTMLGSTAENGQNVYLRPETCQGIFVNFNTILQTSRKKLPFGAAQIGKSFRNEITTGKFIFRLLEFEQMELEYFCHPTEAAQWFEYWKQYRMGWFVNKLGINPSKLRLRNHTAKELSHYSAGTADIEYLFPFGINQSSWSELEGIANRQDYDLKQHAAFSQEKLQYFDPNEPDPTKARVVPFVIETSVGLERSFMVALCDAFEIEKIGTGPSAKERIVLHLHPEVAPVKLAILPIVKKPEYQSIARNLANELREFCALEYDEVSTLGKRYARQDEIGTPLCLTIDEQTLEDNTITIRDRDSREQIRVDLNQVRDIVQNSLKELAQNLLASKLSNLDALLTPTSELEL